MPFTNNCELKIEGKIFRVVHCDYAFNQPVDENNRPNGRVLGGKINLEIDSPGSIILIQWMIEHHATKTGEINFLSRRTGRREKTIKFTEGYVVQYFESYNEFDSNPTTERVVIAARAIEITTFGDNPGSVNMEQSWPK
ncbi:MAG TPA: type VI secretion system tube protein TssD [Bacteroidia bacterium]|nr:type VI secretion system tube protein TssD [Bacteroidia bacterium]